MDFKDIISHLSPGGINNFGTLNFNDIHDNENVYLADTKKGKEVNVDETAINKDNDLVLTPMQEQAFSLAVSRGYMSANVDGGYGWKLRDVTLSYFLGRIFAGDYIYHDGKGDLWHKGDGTFPEKELSSLFSMKNVGSIRRGRLFCNLPREYRLIESLIEKLNKDGKDSD